MWDSVLLTPRLDILQVFSATVDLPLYAAAAEIDGIVTDISVPTLSRRIVNLPPILNHRIHLGRYTSRDLGAE